MTGKRRYALIRHNPTARTDERACLRTCRAFGD